MSIPRIWRKCFTYHYYIWTALFIRKSVIALPNAICNFTRRFSCLVNVRLSPRLFSYPVQSNPIFPFRKPTRVWAWHSVGFVNAFSELDCVVESSNFAFRTACAFDTGNHWIFLFRQRLVKLTNKNNKYLTYHNYSRRKRNKFRFLFASRSPIWTKTFHQWDLHELNNQTFMTLFNVMRARALLKRAVRFRRRDLHGVAWGPG